jgi:SAM-dependent MidA family methyltransferase
MPDPIARSAQRSGLKLPPPDQDAQAHSERLISLIRDEMGRAGGLLPFDRFMELALYAPGLGYYTGGARNFGDAGDFVTAPEVSPLFARCLANQCRQVFDFLQGGELLEVGAGSGVLAAELLLQLQRQDALPERYLILELSPDLRQRQRQCIESRAPSLVDRVIWLDSLPDAGFSGVVVANELLDAMPVHRFRLGTDGLQEQFVALDEGRFRTRWGDAVTPGLQKAVEHLGLDVSDYESEINLRLAPWVQALSAVIDRGLVLLVDYGYPRAEYYLPQRNRGTLMCHYRHRAHPDPYVYPGLQDITAYVDFTAVAESAVESGFEVLGYTTQAFFLFGCGLDQLVAQSDPGDVQRHMAMVQGVKMLTLPGEMGERFKVIGLGRGLDIQPMGFAMRDQRERL